MGTLMPIAIKDLIVWTDNPRMANEQISTETEAIQILIDEVGLNKMRVLAKDIFSYGLNPHRQPIAVLNESGTYNVYDGNRRISVIKCVLLEDKRFKNIVNTVALTLDTKIQVCVTDVEEALRLIEAEHTGEAGGRGQISWEAFQRDYALRQNHKQAIYPYAYEVSRICSLNRKSDYKKIPYTDLDTIFKNEIVKKIFGIASEWDFNNADFIKTVYKKLHDAKTRVPYSRYLPRLKGEVELEEFKQLLFPNIKECTAPQLVLPQTSGTMLYNDSSNSEKSISPFPPTQSNIAPKAVRNPDNISSIANSEFEKRKNNSYKVSPTILFKWRGKGINIDHAVFKPTLEFAIGLQLDTECDLRRVAPYLYRLLLEIALRYWCNWFRTNENIFNLNSIAIYQQIKDSLLGTTSNEVSFISENKIKYVRQVLESIKSSAKSAAIRACFKGRSVQTYADMVRELNEIIHGSKEHIDKSTLEKYDEMVLKYLVALSISLNDLS